jgi:hypothetical protein
MKRITITIEGSDTTYMKAGVRFALASAIRDYNLAYGIQSPLHSYKLGDVEEFDAVEEAENKRIDATLNRMLAADGFKIPAECKIVGDQSAELNWGEHLKRAMEASDSGNELLRSRLRESKAQRARMYAENLKLLEENTKQAATIAQHHNTIHSLLGWLAKEHPSVSHDLAVHLLGD